MGDNSLLSRMKSLLSWLPSRRAEENAKLMDEKQAKLMDEKQAKLMDEKQAKFRNLVLKLRRYLKREEEERMQLKRYYAEVWEPKRINMLLLLFTTIQKLKSDKKTSNAIQMAAKQASIVAKSSVIGGAIVFPPIAVCGLIASFLADGLSLVVSAADAGITDDVLKKINKALKEDAQNTKFLKSLLSDFKMALDDLNNFIDDFYKATLNCTLDFEDMELRCFIKEVQMIEKLDTTGLTAFLKAFCRLVGGSVTSIRSLVISLHYLQEYNPAAVETLECTARILTVDVLSARSIYGSVKQVGMAGAKMGKFVTGLNLFFIARDIADIVELKEELKYGNISTKTTDRLEEIVILLDKELTLLSQGLAKLN